jgi:hypothetical protein
MPEAAVGIEPVPPRSPHGFPFFLRDPGLLLVALVLVALDAHLAHLTQGGAQDVGRDRHIRGGVGDAALALGLSLLFAFAMTWAGACAGMLLRSPESAQALGFIVFLPLSFVSNAFVPTQGMPAWLRDFADWNPISALAATCRQLFGGGNPASDAAAWPMQHPELAVLAWSVALIAVFAPTAVYLYRRKVLR